MILSIQVGSVEAEVGFYVEDNGCDLPDTKDIFEAGYTTNEEGTDLGLRIVSGIATAHGWSIRAIESENSGARFEGAGAEFVD